MGSSRAADAGERKSARADDRKIMNAIFYVLRTGMPWRDLPERYGPYTTAYNRFNRRSRRGHLERSAAVRMLQLMSLTWKTDDEFGVPGTIANFNQPRILTVPKTKVVLPFLNEHLCVDMGFPCAIQYLSCFVQECVVLRPNVKIISGHAAPPFPLAQLAISSWCHP